MPSAPVKLSPAHESPPDWWEAEWHKRQNRARNAAVRVLQRAGRPMGAGEISSLGGSYGGPEMRHALDTLVATGVIRRFTRREPFVTAFGAASKTVERTYYELTEQA